MKILTKSWVDKKNESLINQRTHNSFKTPLRMSKMTQYSYNKWSYSLHLSCYIKWQKSEIELQAQYSMDSQAPSWSLKVWFIALSCPQEHAKWPSYSYKNEVTPSTSSAASSVKAPKLNFKPNTQQILKL